MIWDTIRLIFYIVFMTIATIWFVGVLIVNDTAGIFKFIGVSIIAILMVYFTVVSTMDYIRDMKGGDE